jgi:hypothetical protein
MKGKNPMKKSKATKIIESIAVCEGKSVAEVRADMQEAINIAYKNHDESAENFWSRWNGSPPTPEEFLVRANREVMYKLNFGKTE